jgi:Uma2 family endonuclease
MNVALRKPMTRDEFLAWAESQQGRHEFDGLQPVAMTGGNAVHDRLRRRLTRLLEDRLAGTPCEPFGPDFAVATVGGAIRSPDALVTCTPIQSKDKLATGVVVVFEVLSPGSSRSDRIVKVREYQAVSSIRRYVIVEQDSVGLTVLEKTEEGHWRASVLTGEETLRMPEIGVEFGVAELYDGTTLSVSDDSAPAAG